MYIKLNGSTPVEYTLLQLKSDNKNVSFPAKPSNEDLAEWDVFPYTRPDFPDCNNLTHIVVDGEFFQDETGAWLKAFVAQQRTSENAEDRHRDHRERLFAETDFYALSDVTMSAEMTAYRQALRDLTSHVNWPFLDESDWPVKP